MRCIHPGCKESRFIATVLLIGAACIGVLAVRFAIDRAPAGGTAMAYDDDTSAYTNEERATYSEVFIGTVADRIGEGSIAEPGSEPWLVPLYAVDVDSTLKGQATGTIEVTFVESDFLEPGIGTLAVGQRYLFAAIGPDETNDTYTVDSGVGNVPIANEGEAVALAAEFAQLFEAPPLAFVAEFDPCEGLTGEPTVNLDPRRGPPGTQVRVRVANVVPSEVGIWWRNYNNRAGVADVRADCTAVDTIRVPNDANRGRYDVIVADSRVIDARAVFEVTD